MMTPTVTIESKVALVMDMETAKALALWMGNVAGIGSQPGPLAVYTALHDALPA